MLRSVRNLMIVAVFGMATNLWGQTAPADLSGDWVLTATAQLGAVDLKGVTPTGTCTFEGSAHVIQDGSGIGGDAMLDLVDGDPACPMQMDGSLTGEVSGDQIQMGMMMSQQLGTADFSGGTPQNLTKAGPLGGRFSVTSGSFAGTTGNWAAVQIVPGIEVPTLSAAGLTLLVLLILAMGAWVLRRRVSA